MNRTAAGQDGFEFYRKVRILADQPPPPSPEELEESAWEGGWDPRDPSPRSGSGPARFA